MLGYFYVLLPSGRIGIFARTIDINLLYLLIPVVDKIFWYCQMAKEQKSYQA